MPEGDTLLRTARTLSRVLAGKRVIAFSSSKLPHARLVGRIVDSVDAKGKHLLVRFDDGRVLHSHMRMSGEWHVYRSGERWQRGVHRARCVIEVEGFVAVAFDVPTIRLLERSETPSDPTLSQLGPDVLAPSFDVDEATRRLRALGDREIGDAIVDQRAVSGIGNIYKSESLFAARIHPRTRVCDLDDALLHALLSHTRRIMRASLPSMTKSATRVKERPSVYGRAGLPCRRCGARIERIRQSDLARSTYFCPGCQRSAGARATRGRS